MLKLRRSLGVAHQSPAFIDEKAHSESKAHPTLGCLKEAEAECRPCELEGKWEEEDREFPASPTHSAGGRSCVRMGMAKHVSTQSGG